jgi:hypothetical protein
MQNGKVRFTSDKMVAFVSSLPTFIALSEGVAVTQQ